eukprot:7389207-Prymnesium_polylepis.2
MSILHDCTGVRVRTRALLVRWFQISWDLRQAPDVLLVLPSSQKWPGAHAPLHARLVWPGLDPKRPKAHNSGSNAPNAQKKPTGQTSHPLLD